VLELLLASAIAGTLVLVSVPLTADVLDAARVAMAARYMEGRLLEARMLAIRRSTPVALRFEPAGDGDYQFASYVDGNGNGVRTADIVSGADPPLAPGQRLRDRFPGAAFALMPGVPDVDGQAAPADGVRIGASRILTLGPDGTATSGTLYIRGRGAQYAVRVLGATGRVRVLAFHAGQRAWTAR
jgi:hypothetical protein